MLCPRGLSAAPELAIGPIVASTRTSPFAFALGAIIAFVPDSTEACERTEACCAEGTLKASNRIDYSAPDYVCNAKRGIKGGCFVPEASHARHLLLLLWVP
eukprot:GHVN01051248.1.p1 GENE.GHVN01051248.1~~GHVN01051248.1.p1  ORF type:complete len:101 (-),score=5.10 GHVN01051248.1:182-484(-)